MGPRQEAAMSQLETFPNPKPARDYLIEHICHEFTSVCPKTGQPDFATLRIRYVADRLCVELKSLKFYLQSFRNRGVFFEAVINEICDGVGAVLKPRRLRVGGACACSVVPPQLRSAREGPQGEGLRPLAFRAIRFVAGERPQDAVRVGER